MYYCMHVLCILCSYMCLLHERMCVYQCARMHAHACVHVLVCVSVHADMCVCI